MAEEPLTNEAVLARHVPWESYKTSGQLSDKDYALIKRLDKSNEGARAAVLEEVRPRKHLVQLVSVCWSAQILPSPSG